MSAVLGAADLSRRFKAISSPATKRAFFRDYGLQTTRLAKIKLRRHNKTRNTTLSGKVSQRGDTVSVSFGGAAVFIEKGTKPHKIEARRAKALKFVSKAGIAGGQARLTGTARRSAGRGDVVFVPGPGYARGGQKDHVDHPGTDATPFLLPAARAALKSAGIGHRIVKEWNDAA